MCICVCEQCSSLLNMNDNVSSGEQGITIHLIPSYTTQWVNFALSRGKVGRILRMALCGSEAHKCKLTCSFWLFLCVYALDYTCITACICPLLLSRLKQRQSVCFCACAYMCVLIHVQACCTGTGGLLDTGKFP